MANHRLFWSLRITTIALISFAIVALADIGTGATHEEQIISYLQNLGLPAWGAAMLWVFMRIANELRDISRRLDTHIVEAERRITYLESAVHVTLRTSAEHHEVAHKE